VPYAQNLGRVIGRLRPDPECPLAATRSMTCAPTSRRGCAGRRTTRLMDRLAAADAVTDEPLKAAGAMWTRGGP
jgi:hypothetical protein